MNAALFFNEKHFFANSITMFTNLFLFLRLTAALEEKIVSDILTLFPEEPKVIAVFSPFLVERYRLDVYAQVECLPKFCKLGRETTVVSEVRELSRKKKGTGAQGIYLPIHF